MLKELRNTLIRRDAMIAEYNSNVGMRYANLLGVALVFTLVAQPPLGVALLIVSGAIANLLSYGSIVTSEAHKLKAGYLLLPITPDSEIDCCIDASKGAERYILQAIKHFGEDAVIELAESSPQSFYAMIRDFQALALEVDEMESGEANQAELAAIDTMRSIYFGGTRYDHAPRPETRPAPTLPSYRLPVDETPAPRNYRSLPAQQPDIWDDLPENHGTSDRYLLQAATADNLPKVRDLPREIALLKSHVVIVAKSTAGKSTCLVQVIRHCLESGHKVLTIDAKGCLALRDAGGVYRHANTSDRAVDCLRDIRSLMDMLKTRQDLAMKGHTDFTPQILIIDEINLLRKFLKRDSQESLDEFTEMIAELLLQGASSKIFIRLSSHSSRLKNLGLDGGEADSLSFIGLGRDGSYESLEDILDFQINGRKSKKFQDELDDLIHETFRETLCFSTIAPMGFYRLPWVDQSATVLAPKPEMDYRERLERLIEKTAPEPTTKKQYTPTPKPVLDSPLKEIFEYARTKETIKARDVQNYLTGFRKIPPDEIRSYFQQLEELEYGYCEGEGNQLSFSPYEQ